MRTKVALLVDSSGSMCNLRQPVVDLINSTLNTFRETGRVTGQEFEVDVYLFGTHVRRDYQSRVWALKDYYPNDPGTALIDAVTQVAAETDAALNRHGPYACDAALMVVLTDGLDNRSQIDNIKNFADMLYTYHATDRWTFAFNVPPGCAGQITKFGVPPGNVSEWEQTEIGTRGAEEKTCGGIHSYATARSAGHTSTKAFYATTDASGVTKAQLHDLTECSPRSASHQGVTA